MTRECGKCLALVTAGPGGRCPCCGSVLEPPDVPAPEAEAGDAPATRLHQQLAEQRITLDREQLANAERILAEAQAQLREATILFIDLSSFTRLSQLLAGQPDLLRDTICQFNQVCRDLIVLHRGFVINYIGDCVLAVFGAPRAYDYDAESAVRAALAMRQAVQAIPSPVPDFPMNCRVGLATGQIYSATGRAERRDGYNILGPAVNLASRLQNAGATGQILMDQRTQAMTAGRVEVRPAGPFDLKNLSPAYEAWEVLGLTAAAPGQQRGEPPFVGRARELAALDEAFGRVGPERLALATVTGEAGIGKSRLVRQWLGARQEARALWLYGEPPLEHVMLGVVVEWLRRRLHQELPAQADADPLERLRAWASHADLARALDPADVPYLGCLLGYPTAIAELRGLPPETFKTNLLRSLSALLAGTRVLIVDDAQWLDPLTREWLEGVVKNPPSQGLMLVIIGRPELGEQWPREAPGTVSLTLEPLEAADRRELLKEALQELGELDPGVLERLEERSGGNPLFLAELAELLRAKAREALAEDWLALEIRNMKALIEEGRLGERVPARLLGLMQNRLDRLDQQGQVLVQCASVLGRRFAQSVIGAFEQVREALTERLMLLRGLNYLEDHPLPDDTEWRFIHGLLRDTAYLMIPPDQRRTLHGLAARGLERIYKDRQGEFAEVLAFHYERSDDPQAALPHLLRAADRRRDLGALQQALPLYAQAASLLRALEEPFEHERLQLIRTLIEHGSALRTLARHEEAHQLLCEAETRAAELGNPSFLGWAQLELAIVEMWLGRRLDADRRLDALLAQAGAMETQAWAPLVGVARMTQGIMAYRRGELDEALEIFRQLGKRHQQSATRTERLQRIDSLNNCGLIYWQQGRLEQAAQSFEEALEALDQLREPFRQAATRQNLAIVQSLRGQVREALHGFRRAAGQAREIGHLQVRSAVENSLADLTRKIEEPAASLKHAALAEALAARLGDPSQQAQAAHNLGLALAALGRPQEALEALDRARGHARAAADQKELAWLDVDEIIIRLDPAEAATETAAREACARLAAIDRQVRAEGWDELKVFLARAWALASRRVPQPPPADLELKTLAEALERAANPVEALGCWRFLEQLSRNAGDAADAAASQQRAQRLYRQLALAPEPFQ